VSDGLRAHDSVDADAHHTCARHLPRTSPPPPPPQLSGWGGISDGALRSLALNTGASLTSINLSGTGVTDAQLESLGARLDALRTLRLSGCAGVTNLALRAIAQVGSSGSCT
jgi:hypothetical protein